MSAVLIPFLMITLFVGMIGLAVWTGARQNKRASENLRQLAAKLGLQWMEKPPALGIFYSGSRVSGKLRGKQVEVFPFSTGSGKSRVQWSAVSASVPSPSGLTFHLRRQGVGTKFMELFGAEEIQVRDAEFDRDWFIQTNQPEFLREALLPELRAKITSLVREPGVQARGIEFKLEQNLVRYAEIGSFADVARCQRCARAVDIVCDLTDLSEVFAEQRPGI